MSAPSQSLAVISPKVLSFAQEVGYTTGQVALIKDTVAKGASDDELMFFFNVAKRSGLDPFARQIYLIGRWDAKLQKQVFQTQTSIDGYRLIAERTNRYAPGKEPSFHYDNQNNLISATAYVKKFVAGSWHEVAATAFYEEYVQTTKDGNPTQMWRKMPRLMCAKTAESLALRRAFPAELSGLYTSEEMGAIPEAVPAQQTTDYIDTEVVEQATATPELAPLTATESAQIARLEEICRLKGLSAEKQAAYIAQSRQMRGEKLSIRLEKMEASLVAHFDGLRLAIETAMIEQQWDEDGVLKFYAKHGVEVWADATPAQITAIYTDLKQSSMIL